MTAETKIRAIKGFDANLQCRGFQFEVGKTYHADGEIILCGNGFHAIPEDQHPLSVFGYYPPAGSRFCVVEVAGKTMREGDKIAAETLTVTQEIGLSDLVAEAVKWVMDRSRQEGLTASGDQGAATASGYQGAATASGESSCAMATGFYGRVRGEIDGVDLFARELVWDGEKYTRKSIACGTTGVGGIKAGVWYLCEGGKLVEA